MARSNTPRHMASPRSSSRRARSATEVPRPALLYVAVGVETRSGRAARHAVTALVPTQPSEGASRSTISRGRPSSSTCHVWPSPCGGFASIFTPACFADSSAATQGTPGHRPVEMFHRKALRVGGDLSLSSRVHAPSRARQRLNSRMFMSISRGPAQLFAIM
jgi:hypothetical protein